MAKRNDIEQILHESTLKEISEFIVNPEEKVVDVFMVWMDVDGLIHLLGTTDLMTSLGLVVMAEDMLKKRSWDVDEDEDEE